MGKERVPDGSQAQDLTLMGRVLRPLRLKGTGGELKPNWLEKRDAFRLLRFPLTKNFEDNFQWKRSGC